MKIVLAIIIVWGVCCQEMTENNKVRQQMLKGYSFNTSPRYWFNYIRKFIHKNMFKLYFSSNAKQSVPYFFEHMVKASVVLHITKHYLVDWKRDVKRPMGIFKINQTLTHTWAHADIYINNIIANRDKKFNIHFTVAKVFGLNMTFSYIYITYYNMHKCSLGNVTVLSNNKEEERRFSYCGILNDVINYPPHHNVKLRGIVSDVHIVFDMEMVFSVIDRNLYWSQANYLPFEPAEVQPLHNLYLTCYNISAYQFKIIVNKDNVIILRLSLEIVESFQLFDGPGLLSPTLKPESSHEQYMSLSTSQWQCLLYLLTNLSQTAMWQQKLEYSARAQLAKRIKLNDSQILNMSFYHIKYNLFKISGKSNSFINVSIVNLTYIGRNNPLCSFGGFSVLGVYNKSAEEISTICYSYDGFYQYPSIYSKTNELLILLYSYKEYGSMDIDMTFSLTTCQPVIIYTCALTYLCRNSKSVYCAKYFEEISHFAKANTNPYETHFYARRGKSASPAYLRFHIYPGQCFIMQMSHDRDHFPNLEHETLDKNCRIDEVKHYAEVEREMIIRYHVRAFLQDRNFHLGGFWQEKIHSKDNGTRKREKLSFHLSTQTPFYYTNQPEIRFEFGPISHSPESWIHAVVEAEKANNTLKGAENELSSKTISLVLNLRNAERNIKSSRLYYILLKHVVYQRKIIFQTDIRTQSSDMKRRKISDQYSLLLYKVVLDWTSVTEISPKKFYQCIALPGIINRMSYKSNLANSSLQVSWINYQKYTHYLTADPSLCSKNWTKGTDYEYCIKFQSSRNLQYVFFWKVKRGSHGDYAFVCKDVCISSKSFEEASFLCKSVGGSLPILRSRDEMDELIALLKLSKYMLPVEAIYIGLIRHPRTKGSFIWQNGDAVSFQNYKDYNRKISYEETVFQPTPGGIGHCISIPCEVSVEHTEHLAEHNRCAVMLLRNLAEPEWVLVNCGDRLLADVLCVIDRKNESNISLTSEADYKIYSKCCVFTEDRCHLFVWISNDDLNKQRKSYQFNIEKYKFLFDAVSDVFPPIISADQKYLITFEKYHRHYIFKKYTTKSVKIGGLHLSMENHFPFVIPSNLFECQNKTLISYVFVCNGESDCADNDSSDELNCTCNNKTAKWKWCKYVMETLEKRHCSPFYYPGKDGTCQLYSDVASLKPAINTRNRKVPVDEGKEQVFSKCAHYGMLQCQEICYEMRDICIYKLSMINILTPCINGDHIQNCKTFKCKMNFKCPGYYCVPWAYVCDGKWDCPGGYDESVHQNCGKKRKCDKMFKCGRSNICTHVGDICDGIAHCPLGDDEQACSLRGHSCPRLCECFGFVVRCYNISNMNIFQRQMIPHHVVHIYQCETLFTEAVLLKISNISVIMVNYAKLSEICNLLPSFNHTYLIDFGFNLITKIQNDCFSNGNRISIIKLNNNLLAELRTSIFSNLKILQYIDISNNQILNFISDSSSLLTSPKMLSIINNRFIQFEKKLIKELNVKFLLSYDYHHCCLLPSNCTTHIPWYVSCVGLLINSAFKISSWSISTIIIMINITSILLKRMSCKLNKKKTGAFEFIVASISYAHLSYGIYLLILSFQDKIYSANFIFKDLEWRSSLLCLFASTLTLNYSFLCPSLLVFLSLSRLMVVVYPLDTKFKLNKYVQRFIIVISVVSILTSLSVNVVLYAVYSESASSMCFPLFDPTHSRTVMPVVTWVVVLFQAGSLVSIICINWLLMQEVGKSDKLQNSTGKKAKSSMTVLTQILATTGSELCCWIPSGIIFLVTIFMDTYPIEMVMWTIIAVNSINSVVDPSVFVVTTMRSIWRGMSGKIR